MCSRTRDMPGGPFHPPVAGKRRKKTVAGRRVNRTRHRLAHFSAHEISYFIYMRRNFAPISLNFRDPHFGLFWDLGLLLGYLATSNAKFDVGFLLADPDFLLERRNFVPISLSYRESRSLFWAIWGFWVFGGI